MTREDFLADISDFDDLLTFCFDYDCYVKDEVYSQCCFDEYLDERLVDMVREADGWRDLYNTFYNIPDGYDYYRIDDYENFNGLSWSDFDDLKEEVLEWGDEEDVWDVPDGETFEETVEEEPLRCVVPEKDDEEEIALGHSEDIASLICMVSGSAADYQHIQAERAATEELPHNFSELF